MEGFYSTPALRGGQLVFRCEGDLWLGSLGGDDRPVLANRLTLGV